MYIYILFVYVSVYNAFFGAKTCCLSSKNIFYTCTHNLSQIVPKGAFLLRKQILFVYMTYSSFGCNAIYEYFPTYLFNIHNYNLSIGIFPKKKKFFHWGENIRQNKYFILIAPTETYLVVVSCLVKKVKKKIWHFQSAIKYEAAVIKCRKDGREGRHSSFIDSQMHLHLMVEIFLILTVNVHKCVIQHFWLFADKTKKES